MHVIDGDASEVGKDIWGSSHHLRNSTKSHFPRSHTNSHHPTDQVPVLTSEVVDAVDALVVTLKREVGVGLAQVPHLDRAIKRG